MWRVVYKGFATLDEVQCKWSLEDLLDANIVITAIENAEAEAARKPR